MKVLPDLARAPEAIAARGGELGRPLHLLEDTLSTNDDAKRAAKNGAEHGATWVAESQSAGRGRQGRAWISPHGENLLFSVLLRVEAPAIHLPLVSLVAGLAVADAAERAGIENRVRIKWPNDVVVLAKEGPKAPWSKLAGVLVETSSTGAGAGVHAIIVGVGINVHTRDFPEALGSLATSIALESKKAPDRAEILADILAGLDRDVRPVLARGLGLVHGRLTERDVLRGRRVRSEAGAGASAGAGAGEGVAAGIDLEGRLLVDRDGKREAWNAGEVHLVVG
jgi:BirA family transcriptional regulator, biotin operon repressor / biotin---[acetyl-CoA-carboxylase] ligase